MNRLLLLGCSVLLLLSLPARAEDDYVSAKALSDAGLVKFWQLRLPLDPGQQLTEAYVVDDQLYLATRDGYVFAVHANTGAIRWLRPVGRSGYRIGRPAHAGERVLFTMPTEVLVFDQRMGDALARIDLHFPAGGAGVTDGQRMLIGGLDRRFYAVGIDGGYMLWRFVTNGPMVSAPALHGGFVFAASDDGSVYSCRAKDKQFHWQTATYGAITADLAADENGVYVACRDQALYLLDLLFGQVRWRARFSGPLYEPPILTPEVVYQFCPDDGLVAVNTGVVDVKERIRWRLPRGRTLLTVDPQNSFVLTQDETILAVHTGSGEVTHNIPAPGLGLYMPAPQAGTIYLAGSDGRVFCARARGAPLVRREDIRRALLPPEAQKGDEATTQPVSGAGEEIPDYLESQRREPPIGGKSKVTRSMGSRGG